MADIIASQHGKNAPHGNWTLLSVDANKPESALSISKVGNGIDSLRAELDRSEEHNV